MLISYSCSICNIVYRMWFCIWFVSITASSGCCLFHRAVLRCIYLTSSRVILEDFGPSQRVPYHKDTLMCAGRVWFLSNRLNVTCGYNLSYFIFQQLPKALSLCEGYHLIFTWKPPTSISMAFGVFLICQYDIFQIDLTHNFWSIIGRFRYISSIEYSTIFGTHLINMLGLIIKTLFSKPTNDTTTTCAVWVLTTKFMRPLLLTGSNRSCGMDK